MERERIQRMVGKAYEGFKRILSKIKKKPGLEGAVERAGRFLERNVMREIELVRVERSERGWLIVFRGPNIAYKIRVDQSGEIVDYRPSPHKRRM